MNAKPDRIAVDGIAVEFNRQGGNIRDFAIGTAGGAPLRPLHQAPWVNSGEVLPESLSLVERQLAGDFLCAPFGARQGAPIHGWTANGCWRPEGLREKPDGSKSARYRLRESVGGASVVKELTLVPGHPFLYQCHSFAGGSGHIPIAHHAMIRVPGGAKLSFSKKQFGVTPNSPLETEAERGRSLLAYPQKFASPEAVRMADGTTVDISEYPFAKCHEEALVLAGAEDLRIGWSAALAKEDGFLFFAVKDAAALPETILWMSNGGRHYAPWLSRHTCVLGIEEAATSCHFDHEFSSGHETSPSGLVMGLPLDGPKEKEIRYGFGAIAPPGHWSEVTDIRIDASSLTLVDIGGEEIVLPFNGTHFGL